MNKNEELETWNCEFDWTEKGLAEAQAAHRVLVDYLASLSRQSQHVDAN